jgi:hypothetical protein
MKSPSSMRNGRFHPPKYRGKVQKIGSVVVREFINSEVIN